MSDVNDGSIEAAALAEKVVECEAKLQKLRNLKAPTMVIDQAVRVLGTYRERLMKYRGAERLLTQARIVVDARTQRRRYILEQTLIGKCVAQIDDLNITLAHTVDPDDHPSWPPNGMDSVEVLTRAISEGDSYKIAFALGQVLDAIVCELEDRPDDLLKLGPTYDLAKVN
jgi:hypothetical protein